MGLLKRESEGKFLPFALKRVRAEPSAAISTIKLSPFVINRVRAELPVLSIIVSKPKTAGQFTRNDYMTRTNAQEVAPSPCEEDKTFDSAFNRQATGWNWIWSYLWCSPCHQVANRPHDVSEPKAEDGIEGNGCMTGTTAKDVASIPCRKGKTFELAFDKHVTGLERRRPSSGLTCKVSHGDDGSGKDSLTRSCGSSWSSSGSLDDDDEGEESGESSQNSSSRVDKVLNLNLSAMSGVVSDISSSESESEDSDYDSDMD
jgi:hypothetical protein